MLECFVHIILFHIVLHGIYQRDIQVTDVKELSLAVDKMYRII
jgi:hypothetical protein